MFRSRRRATSNPPPNRNPTAPTPTAALAASQAFLKNANSNASLSSAAAATALRTHSTSPVPVGSIQTKRMQRRGSGGSASSAPGPRRQPSSASMSERTFRSPSPSGRARVPAPADANAPPVPAIPKDLSPASQHRRAASEVVSSSSSSKPGTQSAGGAADRVSRASPASDQGKEGGQRTSINFSRPMSPRVTPPSSPPPTKASHSGWFTSPVVSEQKPRQDIRTTVPIISKPPATGDTGLQQSIHGAANAPVAKKKKKKAPGVEGSHLSDGNMASKPTGSAVPKESLSTIRTQSPPRSLPAAEPPPSPQSPQSSVLSDSSTESDGSGSRIRAPHLVRQPSTVIENPEVEEQAESAESGVQLPSATEEAPSRSIGQKQEVRDASPPADHRVGRVGGAERLTPGTGGAVAYERQSSLSPARSAHFAPTAVDISTGIKHQPPPRSISPAKSALKHSPSSSIRTSSPVASNVVGRSHSDVSSDAGSYDGYKPSPRKKKGVRVSFEENITRDEDSPSSPSSPVGLDSSRWSGRTLQGMDDDLDEILKPRPTLPSFGSIRRGRRHVDEEIAEKVTETVPSMSNSTSTMAEPLEASSDHAVGGVLARDFETRRQTRGVNDPIAPEVTSVEGSGYVSDDTASSIDEEELGPAKNGEVYAAKAFNNDTTELPVIPEKASKEELPVIEESSVPQIAVQPATPGTEAENQEPVFEMPGAWSDPDEGSYDESWATTTASVGSQEHTGITEPVEGGHFHVFSAKDLQPVESQQSVAQYMDHAQDDSSDDDSSIYSDAAEDLSELEGGFASLDAIVDSPVVQPSKESQLASIPESPLADKHKQQQAPLAEEAVASEAGKDSKKGQHQGGSRKTDSKHKLSPKAAALEFDAAPILKSPKPKKKAKVVAEPVAVAVEPQHKPAPLPQAREAPQPRKPALRTSMRAEKPESRTDRPADHAVRKPMRTSMRDGPTGLAGSRYSDTTTTIREPKGALQKKNIPLASTQAAAVTHTRNASAVNPAGINQAPAMPSLSRTLSNDSNTSESSFKRERRAASNADGRYTLRRSMRSGPSSRSSAPVPAPTLRATSPPTASRSSRLSIRSLSPTGSLFGKRKPMVSTQDSSYPTLRSQGPPPSKSSRFSVAKPPSKALSAPLKSASSRFQSRYEDSSDDEDGGRLPTFRSRFADSDDEDEPEIPSGLRPVRGIPRGEEDGDSTELEDEASDTEGPTSPPRTASSKAIEGGSTVAPATNGHTNGAATAGLQASKHATISPISTPRKEKRGFFGLGKKRRESVDAETPTSPTSPTGKLQRRGSHGRRTSESWPLPPPIPDEEPSKAAGRPTTSDGTPAARPKLGKRQSSGGETAESEPVGGVVVGRGGKKKKFPMLRRAFGLKD